ncbi:SGNH/GDSL hydrolase family protein [Gangjinia marincola]|uniref:SGNH/GDSL hydrolase family protein n=1 Tax=Gangjinia marincola TaxID=578463 RepID=A0ABN1ME97_9FLAO
MKKYISYIAFVTLGFVACEPEFENSIEDGDVYTSGEADLSNFVAVGNSLTAGYADGALYITGQENSYPNILSGQFALAGGGEFTQPLMEDNLGGLLLQGQQIAENRFVLAFEDATTPLGPVRLEGQPSTEVGTTLSGSFNNVGVPGAKSFHLVAPGYGNVAGVPTGTANPYYARFASSPDATVLGDAAAQDPSFFTLWIGNNDILGYATSGGDGEDQTGNPDATTYGTNDITDPTLFAGVYSQMVNTLTANGAGGVLVNLPDVTSIPFFTTVPVNAIPLDGATADFLNQNFGLYNTQILPGLVQFGIISAEEAEDRQVFFNEGQNFVTIQDESLTDISAILQGPPFNLDPVTAATLGQVRQATSADLIPLSAAGILGTLVNNDPTLVNGVSVPLSDENVLTEDEQEEIAVAQASYNATIQGLAEANGLGFVDARAILQQVANGGVTSNGTTITSQFVAGGGFSLDGVHPTPRGYALIANLIIDEINATYNSNLPGVDIGNYPTVQVTNN